MNSLLFGPAPSKWIGYSDNSQPNRLDGVAVWNIIMRRAVGGVPRLYRFGDYVKWGEPIQTLLDMAKSSSPNEIADLALIDAFFGAGVTGFPEIPGGWSGQHAGQQPPTIDTCKRIVAVNPYALYGAARDNAEREQGTCRGLYPNFDNPFFWPPPYDMSWFSGQDIASRSTFISPNAPGGVAALNMRAPGNMWGIDTAEGGASWGTDRLQVMNAMNAERAMHDYPWPKLGSSRFVRSIWAETKGRGEDATGGVTPWQAFKSFVLATPRPLSQSEMKTFITLTLVKYWNAISDEVSSYLENKERQDKRDGIVRGIAMFAMGGIMSLLAPAIIGTIFGVFQKTLTAYDKAAASAGLVKMSKQFEESNAAFAAELSRVAGLIDGSTAAAEQASNPSAVELEALAEKPGAYDVLIEGKKVASEKNAETAAATAIARSSAGDRIEILFQGKSMGLFIRTPDGTSAVPKEKEEIIRQAKHEDLVKLVGGEVKSASSWLIPAALAAVLAFR